MKKYRQLCQKNQEENYLLDKYIFRKISSYFTILFIKIKATPNQVTFLSLLASLGSLYFLTFPAGGMLVIGAALIFLHYILDHVDGELARYYINTGRQRPSLKGHYFDVLVHRYSSNLMVFFLGIGIYNLYGQEWVVILGFITCIGISSFPNVIASQVIAGKIATDREIIYNNNKMKEILQEIEKKNKQIDDILHGNLLQKTKKLVIELFFFPGHIVLLILVIMGDVFSGDFAAGSFQFNLRLMFLMVMAVLYTSKTIAQSILWIYRLKHIK